MAQMISRPSPVPLTFQAVEGSAIGPDGTYYALIPGSNATFSAPTSQLMAIGLTATPVTKWTANLTGELGQILPGANTVFLVQTVISGSGRTTSATTSILTVSAATGAAGATITPAGLIVDIQVRTIGGADYLYVHTLQTTTSQNNGTTTTSTARTLTIYSQTGAVVKTAPL